MEHEGRQVNGDTLEHGDPQANGDTMEHEGHQANGGMLEHGDPQANNDTMKHEGRQVNGDTLEHKDPQANGDTMKHEGDSETIEHAAGNGNGSSSDNASSSITQSTDKTQAKNDILRDFCTEWMSSLSQNNLQGLGVFLCHVFSKHFDKKATEAALLTANIIGKSDKTVRNWRQAVTRSRDESPEDEPPPSKRGKFKRKN